MAAQTKITITHDKELAVDLQAAIQSVSGQPRQGVQKLGNFLDRLASGVAMGSMAVLIDDGAGVAASGTVTVASQVQNDTVTIMGLVFTCRTAPSTNVQYAVGADDTACAVSLAAKINAHPSLLNVVTATSALGVVTLTSVQRGLIGNGITIAISAHGSVSGGGVLGSGTASASGVSVTYAYGV